MSNFQCLFVLDLPNLGWVFTREIPLSSLPIKPSAGVSINLQIWDAEPHAVIVRSTHMRLDSERLVVKVQYPDSFEENGAAFDNYIAEAALRNILWIKTSYADLSGRCPS